MKWKKPQRVLTQKGWIWLFLDEVLGQEQEGAHQGQQLGQSQDDERGSEADAVHVAKLRGVGGGGRRGNV